MTPAEFTKGKRVTVREARKAMCCPYRFHANEEVELFGVHSPKRWLIAVAPHYTSIHKVKCSWLDARQPAAVGE